MIGRGRMATPLLAALVLTAAGVVKPIHIDDAAYSYFAAQIADHPAHPYEFEIFWYQRPMAAIRVLAPPVFMYWLGGAVRVFGDVPWLWKASIYPFSLLFCGSFYSLARRYARGVEGPLTWMMALSPTVLPALNLMLDVPAMGLGLASLVAYFRASDRRSMGWALVAGLAAGLASQTKYTALVFPAVMLAHGLIFGRLRAALAAAIVAGLVFAATEALIAATQGGSQLLLTWAKPLIKPVPKRELPTALACEVGILLPAVGLLALAALGAKRLAVAFGMVVALAVIAAIGSPVRPLGQTWAIRVSRPLGVATVLTILAATVATALARGPKPRWRLTHRRKVALFFLSWLLIEGAAYMAMTPFPAARRAIGLSVVLTLLAGRLARRPRRPAVPIALPVAFGIALGVFYYAADLAEAVAQKAAAERSARWVRDQGSGHAWFVGHWGFQYYAEHSGLHPMVPGASRLRAGDWVVVPDKPIDVQASEYPPEDFRASCRIVAGDSLGFRTVINYYSAVVPLAGGARPRAATTIYRVERDLVPVDSKPDDG